MISAPPATHSPFAELCQALPPLSSAQALLSSAQALLSSAQALLSSAQASYPAPLSNGIPQADAFGAALRQWSHSFAIPTLSLFSGAGGLDIGFHDAGFATKALVEIDSRFAATLRANQAPGHRFEHAIVHQVDVHDYHPADLKVDFLIGGPPCQTFSAAGRRAAGVAGTKDKRGSLFLEYIRLLKAQKPRAFLFENVYGITGAEKGEAWKRIQNGLQEAGYRIFWRILDSADYGAPQHRERLIIVGVREGEYRFPRPTHGPDSPGNVPFVTAGQAMANLEIEETLEPVGGRYGHLLPDIPPGLNYSFYTEEMGHPQPVFSWRSKFSDFLYKADPLRPVRTLKAQGGSCTGPFHWENRPFAVAELKRLQSIPDDYHLQGSRQVAIHQIGNSVPPQMARILALSILSQCFEIPLPVELPLLDPEEPLRFRQRKRALTQHYRATAEMALKELKQTNSAPPQPRHYHAMLTPGFAWEPCDPGCGMEVTFQPQTEQWLFTIGSPIKRQQCSITIEPVPNEKWLLPVPRVILQSSELSEIGFPAMWKAFEQELIRLSLKADLVQLCGYYQYPPAFRSTLTLPRSGPRLWQTVQQVVAGNGTREILSMDALAHKWSLSKKQVAEVARFLRRLGYEVRNRSTNPQLPEDHLLIPYAFPTLAPRSVQRHKDLQLF